MSITLRRRKRLYVHGLDARRGGAGTYSSPDALAAHALLSELRTRIAIQRLPYQHGDEARALESLYELFQLARSAMKGKRCSDRAFLDHV